MIGDGYIIDTGRCTGYKPGTILIEDGDRRMLVIWDGMVSIEGEPGAVVYADPDTSLTEIARPESRGVEKYADADEVEGVVRSLPVGSIFVETDSLGRKHRFITTWNGVVIDNGGHEEVAYVLVDRGTSITVESVPSVYLFPTPRCDSRCEDYPENACTLAAGHAQIALEGNLFDHAAPRRGAWWNDNAIGTPEKEKAVTAAYNIVTGANDEEWNPDRTLAALNDLWDAAVRSRP